MNVLWWLCILVKIKLESHPTVILTTCGCFVLLKMTILSTIRVRRIFDFDRQACPLYLDHLKQFKILILENR